MREKNYYEVTCLRCGGIYYQRKYSEAFAPYCCGACGYRSISIRMTIGPNASPLEQLAEAAE